MVNAAFSSTDLVAAAVLTGASYAVLAGCELLAVTNAGLHLSARRIVTTAFLGCAVSNTLGYAAVSGAAVRYRLYRVGKITTRQLAGVMAFYSGTFWLGLVVVGGWALWHTETPVFAGHAGASWTRLVGAALLLASPLYLLACRFWRCLRILGRAVELPDWRVASAQYLLSVLDWALSAGVLWVLLPDPRPPVVSVIAAFAVAQLVGAVSHLPGGIGVFETLIVLQLGPGVATAPLLVALAAFRGIYYLAPFALAVVAIAAYEGRQHWPQRSWWRGRSAPSVVGPNLGSTTS